jgi:succinyl-CoA synthetase beta subunit
VVENRLADIIKYGVPVPKGKVASTPQEVKAIVNELGM